MAEPWKDEFKKRKSGTPLSHDSRREWVWLECIHDAIWTIGLKDVVAEGKRLEERAGERELAKKVVGAEAISRVDAADVIEG